MRNARIIMLAAGLLALGACAGREGPLPSPTSENIVAPAALGAATGGLLGSLSGDFGWGALIGAGAGAAGGYLFDQG
ncbi:MAG TPA: YMGG-like glycine zipper-containing protein [Falsiroseomonas sp.]|jgi:predicted small lipoprotein YifL|nr:YMGG-like glycine zipper-containing protein [Falsiroseomonas sp.]